MTSSMIYECVKGVVSHYIDKDIPDTANLLSNTSVRNIIYILIDLEKKAGLKINDAFIREIKYFSVDNLVKLIPKYQNKTVA